MHRRHLLQAGGLAALGVLSAPVRGASAAKGPGPTPEQTWLDFAARFVRSDGQVVDSGNGGICHSEGQGVALLAAAVFRDAPRFERILAFSRQLRRADQLHAWRWQPGQGITDGNNATDGDLYLAWAMVEGARAWSRPDLLLEARNTLGAVRQHCVVTVRDQALLLPGREGFVFETSSGWPKVALNLSYHVLPALARFADVDDPGTWNGLRRQALGAMDRWRFGEHRLPADWVLFDDPVMPWPDRPARFGYESIRVPLWLAWSGQHQHAALRACARFMQEPGFPAWVSLTEPRRAPYAAPAGFEAVARLLRKTVYGTPLTLPAIDNDYYSSSLTLLVAMAAREQRWL